MTNSCVRSGSPQTEYCNCVGHNSSLRSCLQLYEDDCMHDLHDFTPSKNGCHTYRGWYHTGGWELGCRCSRSCGSCGPARALYLVCREEGFDEAWRFENPPAVSHAWIYVFKKIVRMACRKAVLSTIADELPACQRLLQQRAELISRLQTS